MRRLPDTGQNTSYTGTFGEDNDYTLNAPLFKVLGNGTVIDSITGLMWQTTDGGEMTYSAAIQYCASLNLGGYNNWRLPSAHESFSILNHQNVNPALNTLVFTQTNADYWWSSDRQINDSTVVWVTNAGGGIGNHPISETISANGTKRFNTRAVRSIYTATILPNHYTLNGNETTTDNATGLIWQKLPISDTLTWEDALHYADTSTTGGYNDWRLPNVKELQSLNDEKRISPSINSNFFNVSGIKKFWTSTTLPNQTQKAWYLDTHYGIITYDFKIRRLYVLLVRGTENINTGLKKIETPNTINVYPNPFYDYIKLDSIEPTTYCELINFIGQVVYSGTFIEGQDLSQLNNGLYLLKVYNGIIHHKILIKE